MYGGLFGDLPSFSKGEDGGEQAKNASDTKLDPPQQKEDAPEPTGTKKPTMMFIPQQARRKGQKRPRPAPPSKAKPPQAAPQKPAATKHLSVTEDMPNDSMQHPPSSSQPRSTSIPNAQPQTTPFSQQPIHIESEPESLRRLHEAAKDDPYDPHVPNDLLYYLEQQRIKVERQRLLQLQQTSIQEQEALREQLAEERRILEREGNVDKIVAHRLQTSMGRGNVSNLPAWLLEKQKQQQEKPGAGSEQ